jgi:hypothetical protein
MNCVNHPDAAVAAYCQNCGKALCAACVRSISGVIYCEQCLAAKLGIGGAPAPGGYTPGGYTTVGGVATPPGFDPNGVIPPVGAPNPGTATILGFIPGVGAMYNGQYVKALVHVLVFVILIGITDNHGIFGIFIAAWIAYQVFDAHQTAKARRDGLPLPDPFGLNELGGKLGISNATIHQTFTQTYTPSAMPQPGPIPGPGPGPVPPAAPFTDPYAAYNQPPYNPGYAPYTNVPPAAGAVPPYTPVGDVPPGMDPNAPLPRREPIGAIVLIGLGMLFLLNTLGLFRFNWIGHFWPLFVIGLGAWLLIRRSGANVRFGGRIGKPNDNPPPPPSAGGGQ